MVRAAPAEIRFEFGIVGASDSPRYTRLVLACHDDGEVTARILVMTRLRER